MIHQGKSLGAGMVGLAMVLISGCASKESARVSFSYVVEPEKGLPPGMKTIAIQPAKVGPTTDAKWSDLSATVMQSLVNDSRTRLGTDVAVSDRRDTQITFDEADLAASGMSTAKGGSGGKLLAAQGAIVSNINVKVEKAVGKQRTLSGLDLSGLAGRGYHGDRYGGGSVGIETSEVETVQRTMTVQTDFRLLDTANNKVWDQYSTTQTGTERTKASPIFGSSQTEAALTPEDQIIGTLVERGAREFISRLMPCRIDVSEEVSSSSNANCVNGVKMLRAGLYPQALDAFQLALGANGGDHRAAFGAGLASEATGNYAEALRFYQQAAAGADDPRYIEARDRMKAYAHRARKPS